MWRKLSILTVTGFMALAAIVAGCSDDPAPFIAAPATMIHTAQGGVHVRGIHRDTTARTITAEIEFADFKRRLIIERASRHRAGFSATISGGEKSFTLVVVWNPSHPHVLQVTEMAGSERLDLVVTRSADRITESYNINGDQLTVHYAALDVETRRRTLAHHQRGRRITGSAQEELVQQFEVFARYYERHRDNALHNHMDGAVLTALLSSEAFVEVLTGTPPLALDERANRVCAIATLCGVFKCIAGGIANPICVACTGTSLACAIATIGCWIAPDC